MIFRQLPLEQALGFTAEAGFDAIEIWPPQITECRTSPLRRRLVEFARSLGLELIRLNCADRHYFQSLTPPYAIDAVVRGLKQDIDMASELSMSQVLTWEGRRNPTHSPEEIFGPVLDATVDLFRYACDLGDQRGITLSIEVHPFTLGMDLEWVAALVDRVDHPQFGVTYDCCHFAVGLPDRYVEAIDYLGQRIRHVHFSDSDKCSSELHFAPGTGCLDLNGIISALNRIKFQGTMMLDLWLYPFPIEGSKSGVAYLKKTAAHLLTDGRRTFPHL